MKIAIMQPYFFPYIGYFQLIKAVDKFVLYDDIEYTKKGWVNRNRLFFNNNIEYFTLNLKKSSDYDKIINKQISKVFFLKGVDKILNKIELNYKKAPFYEDTRILIEKIFKYNEINLFNFLLYSIKTVCSYLEIQTEIIISSSLEIDQKLKKENKVLVICNKLNAKTYINPIGGTELYSKDNFLKQKIELKFLKANEISYNQFNNVFIPFLSIIDVLMFNSKEEMKNILKEYQLL